MKISLLINMKTPTIVGVSIFISREMFMLSYVEHENSFITSGPDQSLQGTVCVSKDPKHLQADSEDS